MGGTAAASTTSAWAGVLAFSVGAAVVTLVLLSALLWGGDGVRAYAPFILTVEVGLLAVVAYAVVRVARYERGLAKQRHAGQGALVTIRSCPDYWKQTGTGSAATCANGIVAPGAGPGASDVMYTVVGTADGAKTSASQLSLSDYAAQPLSTLCPQLQALHAPWTELRAACDAVAAA